MPITNPSSSEVWFIETKNEVDELCTDARQSMLHTTTEVLNDQKDSSNDDDEVKRKVENNDVQSDEFPSQISVIQEKTD